MRVKIALRNLVISQIIILLFLVFAYFKWFPHSFSSLGGFSQTALMLIFVDLILGPLLVYIVFKEGKKYLRFDINVLLSIQIVAFVFGAYSLFLKHPAYAVFTGDRFTLTNVSAIYPPQPLSEQLKRYFFSAPKWVIAKIPEDSVKRNALLFDVLLKGAPDIDTRPEYFEPFDNHLDEIVTKALDSDQLFLASSAQYQLKKFINQHGGKVDDYVFFPLKGNNQKDVIWAFNRSSALPIGIIDSDPWVDLAHR